MIYGIKKVIKYLLGKDIAGRGLTVYPDDTFIVSYPRSGNTWTRFLIANLLHPEENVSFANIEWLVPDSEAQSSRQMKRIPRPRVIKSHEYFDHRFPRVVYIVRDPRDVVISYYDFDRKYMHIEDNYPLEDYVRDFVSGRLISKDWGTWGENVSSWVAARGRNKDFLLLRYEDMIKDTTRELRRLAAFFAIEAPPERLTRAIELSSAEKMRNLEKIQGERWVSTKNRRSDIPFVRTASSGSWKTTLSESAITEIELAWGSLMNMLGYEVATVSGLHENVSAVGNLLP